GLALHLVPPACREHPLMEPLAGVTERRLKALAFTGAEPVERDREELDAGKGHGRPPVSNTPRDDGAVPKSSSDAPGNPAPHPAASGRSTWRAQMRLTRVGIPIAVLALMAGCGPLTVSPSVPADPDASLPMPKGPLMADYDRHLATWQASGIARYAFTYSPTCFCPLTQHLIVGDGGVVRIDGVPVDGSVDPPIGAPVGVEGLFEI